MDVLSFIASTVALCLYSASYFFNTKRNYLILQLSGNVFLSLSYLLMGSYFTMVSVAIGIARGLLCYAYEKRDKKVPIYVILGLCLATISSYVIINFVILSDSSPWDFLYLMSSCAYAVTFAMRNIRVMRYAVLVPNALAVAYNLLIKAPISSAISYGVEFAVTVVAIIKCEIKLARERKKAKSEL
ncbi:MAG: YgjV family protein [Clostridia bacterium]|nr:YgjV family protein [Clostridia bacterium]MBP3370438.1 YgjV family protein [Clostridia bacterium]